MAIESGSTADTSGTYVFEVFDSIRNAFASCGAAFAALAFALSQFGGSYFEPPDIPPPEVFTVNFDDTFEPMHGAEAALALRRHELPFLPDDRHASRKASAGMLETARG